MSKQVQNQDDEDIVALWWIAGGLVVIFGIVWLAIKFQYYQPGTSIENYFSSKKEIKDTTTQAIKQEIEKPKHAIVKAELGEFKESKLPDGVVLDIPELGIENKLLNFIKDSSKVVDKTTWFDFDRLLFETGSTQLKPESQEQLENIVKILKAYPNVEIKVGGYTDNVGNPENNLKLSQVRAEAVKAEMVKMGIPESRISAEGYGDKFPVASNDTEEGREKNRRVSLRVTKK